MNSYNLQCSLFLQPWTSPSKGRSNPPSIGQVPFASEAMKDLSFVFRFRGNTKPVRRPVTSDEDEATIPFSTNSSGQYAASGYGYNNRT